MIIQPLKFIIILIFIANYEYLVKLISTTITIRFKYYIFPQNNQLWYFI